MAQTMKAPTAHAAKLTLRPLHDRVLVKRIEEATRSTASIIIPDSAKEKPQEGKVIAVGSGKVTEDGKKLPSTSRPATASCSASTPAARSS